VELIANWLIQGSALAAATTLLLRGLPRLSASTRYVVWWMTLAAVLVLPVLAWLPARDTVPPAVGIATASGYDIEMPLLPRWPFAVALAAFAVWTAWSLVSLGFDVRHLFAAKRRCRDVSSCRQDRLPCWSTIRDRGRRARLVVCADVRGASVLGLTSPAIAVAPVLLDTLEDAELDCVLAHEWAHVQRRDDFARLLQVSVRAIAGLHPAVWWIDRQLHLDRETACDDWAINLTGSARRYAASLTRLASLDLARRERVLLPAAISRPGLTRRIERLLDPRRSSSTKSSVTATLLTLPSLMALATAVTWIEFVVPSPPRAVLVLGATTDAVLPRFQISAARDAEGGEVPVASSRSPVRRRRTAPPEIATATVKSVPAIDRTGPAPRSSAPQMPLETTPRVFAAVELPGAPVTARNLTAPVLAQPSRENPATPWDVAADAGIGIGKGSQKAAVRTAAFFSRMGKSIARSF
jgi:beta-lactamase regulating signal transducer with metallopeptidase domain